MPAWRWIGVALALAAAGAGASRAGAQELARLARQSDAARVRITFPARPGVCGTGDGILVREPGGSTLYVGRRFHARRDWQDGDPPCETGAVRVELTRSGDGWSETRLAVVGDAPGRPEAGLLDLGAVTGQAAVDFLLGAARTAGGDAARDLVLAASLAGDAIAWPGLLALARDRSLPDDTRRAALRWLGREAAEEAVRGLGGIVRDSTEADEIREAAVFGLAQLPGHRAVPLLMDVARTSHDPRMRSRALFWLAGFDDPRVVTFFEEMLAGTGGR